MKVIEGVALIAGAIVATVLTGGLASPLLVGAFGFVAPAVLGLGASLLMGGIADAIKGPTSANGQSMAFSIKQPAANRQIVYGQCRIAGTIIYESSTNENKDLNTIVAWHAGGGDVPQLAGIDTIYLDGRAVVPSSGTCDSSDHTDDAGNTYNFKGKVFIENRAGGVSESHLASLGDIDSKWDSTCLLNGIAYSYIRATLDTTVFQGMPGIKANVRGKHLYDPRINGIGYSNNAVLVIADVLMSSDYGLGCPHDEIDWEHVVAMANICDEEVVLANGATEKRYTINGAIDTSWTPGDIIQSMLDSIAGRIGREGNKWRIYPGAYYPSSLVFFDSDLIAGPTWSPVRKTRDRVNAMRATFISPRYPFSQIIDTDGNTIDQDTKDPDTFSGQWQPADIPEYAQDVLHGYPSDANLAADGGQKLYGSLNLRFCTSLGQAQRVAKINLLRNRFGGSGTLRMKMSAYQLTAGDVFAMTFAPLGWELKLLEVQSLQFVPGTSDGSAGQDAPAMYVELQVAETNPGIYLWSPAEELSMENTQSPVVSNAWDVNPPNNLLMESGIDSAVVGTDGITIPRIRVLWDEPRDPFTLSGGYVELQWQTNGDATWWSAGLLNATTTSYFINNVVCGHQYNVRMRACRASGASSARVSAGPHTVSVTVSSISHENIAGLGALATRNNVDFASGGDILNKNASNLNYSTGFSVESLRPVEANSERTTGKSLDILADGSTYARVRGNQLMAGAVQGLSSGINLISNPGFENYATVQTPRNVPLPLGSPVGSDWTIDTQVSSVIEVVFSDSLQRSGALGLVIQVGSGLLLSGAGARVLSSKHAVIPGAGLVYGGWTRQEFSQPMPGGVNLIHRMGLVFTDANGGFAGEANIDLARGDAPGVWKEFTKIAIVPVGAAFVQFGCSVANIGSTVAVTSTILQAKFDDLYIHNQYDRSSVFNRQASILPSQSQRFNYTVTNNSVTFTWDLMVFLQPDGTEFIFGAGSKTYTGLSPEITYYTYWCTIVDGILTTTNSDPPPTAPDPVAAMLTCLDGRYCLGVVTFTTLAASNPGTGGGAKGGAATCPDATELVEVEGKGQIQAGQVVSGDRIRGKSFATGQDVYRTVVQVKSEMCSAWRIVNGHRVTPCEPVYVDGQWMPAYRATNSTFDASKGTKMFISVASDEYDEQNYYLVSGDQLLIHNAPMLAC